MKKPEQKGPLTLLSWGEEIFYSHPEIEKFNFQLSLFVCLNFILLLMSLNCFLFILNSVSLKKVG